MTRIKEMTKPTLNKKEIDNAIWVITANIICLLLSLITGILLPKFVSTGTYAYYKTYTLYITYAGLFHFGMINGIYLKYGSYSYEDLPKHKFVLYSRILMLEQLIVQLILFSALFLLRGFCSATISFFFIVLNIFSININTYYSLINQFTLRFRRDSIIQLLTNVFNSIIIVILLLFKNDNAVLYLSGVTLVNLTITVVWVLLNKEITYGHADFNKTGFTDIKAFVKSGLFVMLSEFAGLIILGIDSIFVNLFFSNYEFAVYSFAISVISILIQLISLGTKLIFPYLMRTRKEKLGNVYESLSIVVVWICAVLMGLLLICNYGIKSFINTYEASIPIIRCLGIVVIFRGLIELVCGNMYKVMGLVKEYWKNNLLALILGFTTDLIAAVIWKNIMAIAIASVVSFSIWYCITTAFFSKKLGFKSAKIIGNVALIIALFEICASIGNIGFFIYYIVLAVLALTIIKKIKSFSLSAC